MYVPIIDLEKGKPNTNLHCKRSTRAFAMRCANREMSTSMPTLTIPTKQTNYFWQVINLSRFGRNMAQIRRKCISAITYAAIIHVYGIESNSDYFVAERQTKSCRIRLDKQFSNWRIVICASTLRSWIIKNIFRNSIKQHKMNDFEIFQRFFWLCVENRQCELSASI